jgi:hypothetical protein
MNTDKDKARGGWTRIRAKGDLKLEISDFKEGQNLTTEDTEKDRRKAKLGNH